ncbi:SDR family NAD(P)-dependent oxidoreductase, partial [Chloroflexota bacterium]
RVMEVNLKSMFLTCKYVLPYMEKQRDGSIVNVSSIDALAAPPFSAISYSASKAGVIALTRDIAAQYATKGIRANAVLPGYINTPMVVESLTQTFGGDVNDMMKKRDRLCPTGKQGEPWDVAHAALFLVSNEAKYITGTFLVVDGGVLSTL